MEDVRWGWPVYGSANNLEKVSRDEPMVSGKAFTEGLGSAASIGWVDNCTGSELLMTTSAMENLADGSTA